MDKKKVKSRLGKRLMGYYVVARQKQYGHGVVLLSSPILELEAAIDAAKTYGSEALVLDVECKPVWPER